MIAQLHYITQEINGLSHLELAREACQSGVRWVQLRVKNKPFDEWVQLATDAKQLCLKFGAKLIINDNAEIARRVGADGVHLGKNDMNPSEARELLGNNFIIGGTANTIDDIRRLAAARVDYIGLGPFRFTQTKENLSPILGLEGYFSILKQVRDENIQVPIIAIGGIVPDDVERLMQTGIHGIAVSSGINCNADKEQFVSTFLNHLNKSI
ncbi:MAG: thiamine phosphate synthase [Bacteroidota bacterium]|nr:thiamine phosphate synthase [Bacteroidota bacterium]